MRRAAFLILALPLAACGIQGQWTKEGTSPEAAARDLAACRSLAQSAVKRDVDIDQDIMATRGHDWQTSGVLTARRATYDAHNQAAAGDIVTRCMTGKGYVPAS
jgi:hypothetical protein